MWLVDHTILVFGRGHFYPKNWQEYVCLKENDNAKLGPKTAGIEQKNKRKPEDRHALLLKQC